MYEIPSNVDWSFLVGKEVVQLCIGSYDIQLNFHGDFNISMFVDQPTKSFHHTTTHTNTCTVGGVPGGAITLISLLGATVQRVVVENSRILALYFSNHEELRLYETGDGYESFTISGPNVRLIVV
jgi:hypothetical protein